MMRRAVAKKLIAVFNDAPHFGEASSTTCQSVHPVATASARQTACIFAGGSVAT
jgi:hypothetical protein